MEEAKLKEVLEKAAAMVKKIPNNLQKEAFLTALDVLLEGDSPSKPKRTRKRKSKAPKKTKTTTKATSNRTTSGSPSAKQILESLIQENYFKDKRLIGEIQEYIKDNKAQTVKTNTLSPTLGRLTRSGSLKRKKNKEGQYEYWSG